MTLNYFLISVISYLGIILGYIFLHFAPEENAGRKYFSFINKALFILSLFVLVFFTWPNVFALVFSIVFFILFIIFVTLC